MSSFGELSPTSLRRWVRLPAAVALGVAAALFTGAGPARADNIVPTLTSFQVSSTSVDVTRGTAQVTVLLSVTDPDASGVGHGDVIARAPNRGYNPFGDLVQVGGTARNTQFRADITLPAGKAVDYNLEISYEEADQFTLVDLQSQLVGAGWPHHVQALVTAPPVAARHLTFRRELLMGKSTVVVTWDPPAAGEPVPSGSTLTGSTCGTLRKSFADEALFIDQPPSGTCTVTVRLVNGAGSAPPVTAAARV
jgi:hypothetical protein